MPAEVPAADGDEDAGDKGRDCGDGFDGEGGEVGELAGCTWVVFGCVEGDVGGSGGASAEVCECLLLKSLCTLLMTHS